MKQIILFLICIISIKGLASGKTKVYLFSGLGSDARIFEKIKLNDQYEIVNILYPIPPKKCTMKEYALMLRDQIDTTGKYIFIGVSIGGMICVELRDILRPEKVIIISSAKCRQELPFRYRFQKSIPLNKIVPAGVMKGGAKILQPIVEPDRNKNKKTFKAMLRSMNKRYLKRSVDMIINWNRKDYNKDIIHIHGTKDHTLPFRHLKATYPVKKGSHMIALTRGDEMNLLILSILDNKL
jgi:pimeloyl-ACP methyl ester carboxylesterase